MASKPLQRVIRQHVQRRARANYQPYCTSSGDTSVDEIERVSSVTINSSATVGRSHCPRRLPGISEFEKHVIGVSYSNHSKQPIRHVHNAHTTLPTTPMSWYDDEAADTCTHPVKSFDEIPGPTAIPLIGGLFHYLQGGKYYNVDFGDVITRMYAEYGGVVKETWPMGFSVVHVYNPDDIEIVYRSDGKYPLRHAFSLLEIYNRKYANDVQGLLTSHEENWHRLRRSVQQKMLQPKAVSAYLPDHAIVADDLVMRIRDTRDARGDVTDLRSDLYKYAAESIGVVCFNKRLGAFRTTSETDEAARYLKAVDEVMDTSRKEFSCFPFYRWFETPLFKRMSAAQGTVRRLAEKYSDLAVKEKLSTVDSLDGEAGDLIPYLLTKTSLTRADVITLISELITAGVETTSHLLAFTLYSLACSDEAQSRLHAELDAVVPDCTAEVTPTHMDNMPYLRAVLLETLRYHPVVPGNCRTLTKDIVCSNYKLPKGTFVALRSDWATRDRKYFSRPNEFVPERWLRSGDDANHHHPFANTQFGFGSRSCIGKRLAKQEVSIAIVKILQKYRIEYHREPLQIKLNMTYVPSSPLNFRFVERR